MKKYILLFALVLLCGICNSQTPDNFSWDADVQNLKIYKAGTNQEILLRLKNALYGSSLKEDAKRVLSKKLISVFQTATPDGQNMIFSLLCPLLDEETAKPLIPLLSDPAVAPETAKITLMFLQEVPGKSIDTALLNALAKKSGDLKIGLIAAVAKRKMNSAVIPLASIVRENVSALLTEAAAHALAQIPSGESLQQLETLKKEGFLSSSSNDALTRARETKNPNLRNPFLVAPYDPNSWPGMMSGNVERVDVDKIISDIQHKWMAEKDSSKRMKLTKLYASKATLLSKPSTAFITLLQKADHLEDQKAILVAMGEKCCAEDVITLAAQIMKENTALRATAGLALVRMANQLRRTTPDKAQSILVSVQQNVQNSDIAKRAGKVLDTISQNEECIREWLYSGPFVLENKSGEEVFRHVFPAEGDRAEIRWEPLIAGWQGGHCWNLEVGIEPMQNAAACLKTYIWSDSDQTLIFQAAGTGGIAAWCNKQSILNQWRNGPFEQWTFSAPIALKKGYNTLVIKTAVVDSGCLFSARLRTKDNRNPGNIRIERVRRDPTHKILLFTGSQSWIHSPTVSGPNGNSCAELILKDVCRQLGFELVWTDSGEFFNCPLDEYAAFIFYTCGELDEKGKNGMIPFDEKGKKAFLTAIREQGTGFFAIHSASDTWHKWPDYVKLVGAEFVRHGMQQEAEAELVGNALSRMKTITGKKFHHYEEWYAFRNFNPDMHILMMQNTKNMITEGINAVYKQSSYPCTWVRAEGKGIVAFTSLGHSCEYWRSDEYRALLLDLISMITRKSPVDLTPNFNSMMNRK